MRQGLELEDEQGRQRGALGLEFRLAFQDQQRLFHREPTGVVLGLGDDVSLERREVVADPRHGGPHQPEHLDLRAKEGDGQRQPGRREQLFPDPRQDILGWQPVDEPLAEGVEEIRLLDIFLAIQDGHRLPPHGDVETVADPAGVPQRPREPGSINSGTGKSR